MATLNENITRIEEAKIAIKNAIIGKGVAVDDTALLDTYASKIIEIPTSGGGIDVTGTGWENEPTFPINVARLDTLNEDLDYTRTEFAKWEAKPDKTSANTLYEGDTNLVYAPAIDFSSVTDASECFNNCPSLTALPLLDFSKVTNANACFMGCSSLTTLPPLDFNKVISAVSCFYGCTSLTALPPLDFSSVTNMYGCFGRCISLTTFPQLDFSKVTNASGCFGGCTSLISTPSLDFSKVTDVSYCFQECYSLTSVELTGGIRTDCNCTYMFYCVTTTGVLKIHTGNGITRDNYQPVIDKLPATWTVEEITDELPVEKKIEDRKTVEITSNGTTEIDPSVGFDGIAGATVNVNVPELNGFDWTGTGLDNSQMNDRVQNDINYTKEKYSSFDATATDVSQKFANDTKLVYAPNVDFSKATVANQVFANDINLKYIPDYTFGRLTECKGLFEGCTSLKEVSYLKFTSDVCGMNGLFKNCTNLERVGTLSFNGSYSTADMFKGCVNLVDFRGIPDMHTNLDLGDCAKLSFESVTSILSALPTLGITEHGKIVFNSKVIPPVSFIPPANQKGWRVFDEMGREHKKE